MRVEENQGHATADQVLGEIRDYCRATRTAESTFGRLVVNDGKLVSRLRDGAKITTGTLDKVRAYLSEHRSALSACARQAEQRRVAPGAKPDDMLSPASPNLSWEFTASRAP